MGQSFKNSKIADRIKLRTKVDPISQCWLWCDLNGVVNKSKYGKITVDNKTQYVHRVAFQLWISEIPNGLCVLHKCDTPACLNPAHLHLGTQLENIQDMDSKGRRSCVDRVSPEKRARGERHGRSKLSWDLVREIREKASKGISRRLLAEQYDVSIGAITKVVKHQTWRTP